MTHLRETLISTILPLTMRDAGASAIADAILALLPQWQDIESAPKDGAPAPPPKGAGE